MGTWNSRGLRGSTLEDMINHSNEVYREKKLAPPYHSGVFRPEKYGGLYRYGTGDSGVL